MKNVLKVNEMFLAVQGESTRAGRICVMVRLTGCNLDCVWCDTLYAREEGRDLSIDEIVSRVRSFGCSLVEVTGGEPMIQTDTGELLRRLCDEGIETLLETNGSIDLKEVDRRVIKIMDVKCPSSGFADATNLGNFRQLQPSDEIKFVIADRRDYEFAIETLKNHSPKAIVIFSPAWNTLPAKTLAGWMLQDKPNARLGLQLHKIIYPETERGV